MGDQEQHADLIPMATATKKQLIKAAAKVAGMSDVDGYRMVSAFLEEIIDRLEMGDRVEIRDFGIFDTRQRGGRVARNVRTGEVIQVPQRRVVRFRPGLAMRRRNAL